jgi:hypothetical protein
MKSYLCRVRSKVYRKEKKAHHKLLVKGAVFFCFILLCCALDSPFVLATTGAGTVPQGSGAFFYIRQGGSGNGSDWSNAMGDLPSTFQRGATYYVAAGTYGGHDFSTPESGSQWIIIKRATQSDHGTDSGWQSSYDGIATFTAKFTFETSYWALDGVTGSGKGQRGFDLALTATGEGIDIYSGTYISLRHMAVHWPDRDTYVPATGVYAPNGTANITIAYCYFAELGGMAYFLNNSHDLLFEYNAVVGTHSDAQWHASVISMRNGSNNGTIRYNWFQDVEGTGLVTFYDPGVHSNWDFYGNVVYQTSDPRVDGFGNGLITDNCIPSNICGTNNVKIYNNTFVGLKQGNNNSVSFYGYTTAGDAAYNNIWYDSAYVHNSGVDYDYNYYSKTFFYLQAFNPAAHEPASDAGKNSIITADPFVDSAHENFHLKAPLSGYPGMALSATYNRDMEGRLRGADGVWDPGAYEYGPGVTLIAPQNLRIQN